MTRLSTLACVKHPISGALQLLSVTDSLTPRFHFWSLLYGSHERYVDTAEARAMLATWALRTSEGTTEIRFWHADQIKALFGVSDWSDLVAEGAATYAAELAERAIEDGDEA